MLRRSANFAVLAIVLLTSTAHAQVPNDQVDDTQYLQTWLDEQSKPATDRKPLAAGKYIVSETLRLGPTMGLKISGAGGHDRSPNAGWDAFRAGTIFEWRGEAGGTIAVAGVAWHQHVGIAAVDVQVDDGPWQPATLAEAISIDTWVQWRFDWDAESGSHTLRVRATDADGEVQTSEMQGVVPDGATGLHERSVSVG